MSVKRLIERLGIISYDKKAERWLVYNAVSGKKLDGFCESVEQAKMLYPNAYHSAIFGCECDGCLSKKRARRNRSI